MIIVQLSYEEEYYYRLCHDWLMLRGKSIGYLSRIEGDSYKEKWNNLKKTPQTSGSEAREKKLNKIRSNRVI